MYTSRIYTFFFFFFQQTSCSESKSLQVPRDFYASRDLSPTKGCPVLYIRRFYVITSQSPLEASRPSTRSLVGSRTTNPDHLVARPVIGRFVCSRGEITVTFSSRFLPFPADMLSPKLRSRLSASSYNRGSAHVAAPIARVRPLSDLSSRPLRERFERSNGVRLSGNWLAIVRS